MAPIENAINLLFGTPFQRAGSSSGQLRPDSFGSYNCSQCLYSTKSIRTFKKHLKDGCEKHSRQLVSWGSLYKYSTNLINSKKPKPRTRIRNFQRQQTLREKLPMLLKSTKLISAPYV